MLFRRAAVLLPVVLFVACSFPDYQFDDARFNAQNGEGDAGEGGTEGGGKGGKGGTTGKGGAGAGGTGDAGAAGAGEGGTAGKGGGSGGAAGDAGGSGGASGSASGAGGGSGSTAGSSGKGGAAGMGGSGAGTGGAGGTAGAGGSAGKGGSAPAGTCTSASDCKASELCSEPVTIGTERYFKCFPKNPDAGAVKAGGLCDDNTDCESFVCLMVSGATKGICSGTCGTRSDCASTAVCFDGNLSQNSTIRICQPECLSDAGCDPGLKANCALYEDTLPAPSVVGFSCQPTIGADFGAEPAAGQSCKSSVLIGTKCTKPCESQSECEAPFPACKSGPIGTASGGTAVIKVCSTQ